MGQLKHVDKNNSTWLKFNTNISCNNIHTCIPDKLVRYVNSIIWTLPVHVHELQLYLLEQPSTSF